MIMTVQQPDPTKPVYQFTIRLKTAEAKALWQRACNHNLEPSAVLLNYLHGQLRDWLDCLVEREQP